MGAACANRVQSKRAGALYAYASFGLRRCWGKVGRLGFPQQYSSKGTACSEVIGSKRLCRGISRLGLCGSAGRGELGGITHDREQCRGFLTSSP